MTSRTYGRLPGRGLTEASCNLLHVTKGSMHYDAFSFLRRVRPEMLPPVFARHGTNAASILRIKEASVFRDDSAVFQIERPVDSLSLESPVCEVIQGFSNTTVQIFRFRFTRKSREQIHSYNWRFCSWPRLCRQHTRNSRRRWHAGNGATNERRYSWSYDYI